MEIMCLGSKTSKVRGQREHQQVARTHAPLKQHKLSILRVWSWGDGKGSRWANIKVLTGTACIPSGDSGSGGSGGGGYLFPCHVPWPMAPSSFRASSPGLEGRGLCALTSPLVLCNLHPISLSIACMNCHLQDSGNSGSPPISGSPGQEP